MTAVLDRDIISAAAADLEDASGADIIAWGVDRFGDDLVVTTSFQDCVLVDLAVSVKRDIRLAFLDTQYHFPETWAFVDTVRARYPGLNLDIVEPLVEPDDLWQRDVEACCGLRKVEPLERLLGDRPAWVTGLRRADSPLRAATPVVHLDKRGKVKLNPLALWSDDDMAAYARERGLPEHPLIAHGFRSIGCWPCTRAVRPGEDPRAGRWAGTGKSECGLHV